MSYAPSRLLPLYFKVCLIDKPWTSVDEKDFESKKDRDDSEVNPLVSRLTPERLVVLMPIAKTLVILNLGYDVRVDDKARIWIVPWLNRMLRGMPLLTIFLLGYPLMNLDLFEGLGRDRRRETDSAADHHSDWWCEERPFLEAVAIVRSVYSCMLKEEFSRDLYAHFRFMKVIKLAQV